MQRKKIKKGEKDNKPQNWIQIETKESNYIRLNGKDWCWEILRAREGDDRGWDGWMASLTQWTWVWAGSRSWGWTGKPGVLQSVGLQRVGCDWATELNWRWWRTGKPDALQFMGSQGVEHDDLVTEQQQLNWIYSKGKTNCKDTLNFKKQVGPDGWTGVILKLFHVVYSTEQRNIYSDIWGKQWNQRDGRKESVKCEEEPNDDRFELEASQWVDMPLLFSGRS